MQSTWNTGCADTSKELLLSADVLVINVKG